MRSAPTRSQADRETLSIPGYSLPEATNCRHQFQAILSPWLEILLIDGGRRHALMSIGGTFATSEKNLCSPYQIFHCFDESIVVKTALGEITVGTDFEPTHAVFIALFIRND